MSTSRYLDSVLKVLPAFQARQISDLLARLQSSGQIRDASEYANSLRELSTLINDQTPKPTFRQIRALVWHLCSSEAHNQMMLAAQGDIQAIFLQANEMGEKTNDHHYLMLESIAADMEMALKEQENTIERLEWLANDTNDFTHALVNSFSSASLLRTTRTELGAENLYFDNRTNKNQLEDVLANAIVSEHGNKLILDTINEPKILPISAKLLSDENSYGTEAVVEIENDISNILDGTKGTYWTRTVYLKDSVEKVTTVLELDLGLGQDINYIIIEGATSERFNVESIIATTPDGYVSNLYNTITEVDGNIRIDFDLIFASKVKVTFSISSYTKEEDYIPSEASISKSLDSDNYLEEIENIDNLSSLIKEALISDKLADLCHVPNPLPDPINYYVYSFGLDNIWFGNSNYSDIGVFVSTPLRINSIGTAAVYLNMLSETGIIQNSIECDLIKIDRFPKYKEIRFPIPYMNQTTVESERLILTHFSGGTITPDAGQLRFCPYIPSDWEVGDTSPISVYKDGVLQQLNEDWQLAVSSVDGGSGTVNFGWLATFNDASYATGGATLFDNYNFNPPKTWIKILNPIANAVYTVNYTIRTNESDSNANTLWLDKDKTVSLGSAGQVYFKVDDPDILTTSDLYLQITLRRNLASQSSSPELYKYAILGATYNNG